MNVNSIKQFKPDVMKEAKSVTDDFRFALQNMWSAETMLVEAMPKLVKQANTLGLEKLLALHLAETDQHKIALQAICKQLDIHPQGVSNTNMQTILQEGEIKINAATSPNEKDKAIIEGAKKVEQYEIEQYRIIAKQAEALGYEGIAKRLWLTLEEEEQASTKLDFLLYHLVQPGEKKISSV